MSQEFSPPLRTFCNSGWSCMKTVRDQFKEICCGIARAVAIQLDNVQTETHTTNVQEKLARTTNALARRQISKTRKSGNPAYRCPPSPTRFVPPETPQVAKPGKICRLGMSSIGKSHQTGLGGSQLQEVQGGAQHRGPRMCPNRVISNW